MSDFGTLAVHRPAVEFADQVDRTIAAIVDRCSTEEAVEFKDGLEHAVRNIASATEGGLSIAVSIAVRHFADYVDSWEQSLDAVESFDWLRQVDEAQAAWEAGEHSCATADEFRKLINL